MYPKRKLTAYGLQPTVKTKTVCKTVTGKQFAVSAARQRGWLMPVAAFIVVIMGLLAAGMGLVSSQSSIASTQEQISVQAFYAAESGAQYGMNRLFYDTGTPVSRASATTRCNAVSGTTLNFNVAGMLNCQTTIACTVNIDSADTTSFFNVSSTASCGIAPVTAVRIVDVAAYLQ